MSVTVVLDQREIDGSGKVTLRVPEAAGERTIKIAMVNMTYALRNPMRGQRNLNGGEQWQLQFLDLGGKAPRAKINREINPHGAAYWLNGESYNGMVVPATPVRRDFRLIGSRRDPWSPDKMMSADQWATFFPSVKAVISWASQAALDAPPTFSLALRANLTNAKSNATRARDRWQEQEALYLAALDAVQEHDQTVYDWYASRGMTAPIPPAT